MNSRIPLTVAVVGALLIGGAATGTTLAAWRDQTLVARSSMQSGTIKLDVNGSTTATFSAINNLALNTGATPGAAESFTATLKNSGTGKNLRMTAKLLDVTTSSGDLNDNLEIAIAGVVPPATCPSPTYQLLSATNVHTLATSLFPGGTATMCVSVRVRGGAPSSAGSRSGALTFSFSGEQVLP